MRRHFQTLLPDRPKEPLKADVFPGYAAPFVRRPAEWDSGDEAVPAREAKQTLTTCRRRAGAAEIKPRHLHQEHFNRPVCVRRWVYEQLK